MSWTIWAAVVVVCVTVWALIKRYETRLVLLVSGLVMALLSLDPMMAFKRTAPAAVIMLIGLYFLT